MQANTDQTKLEPTPTTETLVDLLTWLDSLPPTGKTKEEVLAQIAEERNAWGD